MMSSPEKKGLTEAGVAVVVLLALAAGAWILVSQRFFERDPILTLIKRALPASRTIPVRPKKGAVISVSAAKQDNAIREMMIRRKKHFGVDKSVDLLLWDSESLKIGGRQVDMDYVARLIRAAREKKGLAAQKGPTMYGVHVVQKGENLWKIHYAILRDYFKSRGIELPPRADEPKGGKSSGVGRILKFAELQVYVYNTKTKKLDKNLNVLEAGERVVIFNLTALTKRLSKVSLKDLNAVHLHGKQLIVPGKKPLNAEITKPPQTGGKIQPPSPDKPPMRRMKLPPSSSPRSMTSQTAPPAPPRPAGVPKGGSGGITSTPLAR